MFTGIEQARKKTDSGLGKIRNYNEIIDYLDALPSYEYSEASVIRMKALDKALQYPSSKLDLILVGGTNGKSLAMHFATKLFNEEAYKVSLSYSSHLLSYNERLAINNQTIQNKQFTEIVNEVINVAEELDIQPTAYELTTMAALLNGISEQATVALLEVCYGGKYDATTAFTPKISAVTRITEDHVGKLPSDLDQAAFEMLEIAKPGTWFISAEQSKIRLQKMKTIADQKGILWAMPIRKLSALPYIYEQLYGRVASLGERIAQIYVEDIQHKFSPFLRGNLLATEQGRRGRPTLEAKRNAELNPIKTLKIFWSEQFDLIKGRFELLDKEKPSILLDVASNIDALSNVFLGIRLLHYQKPLKGLALVIGLSKHVNIVETMKLIRYMLKKINGQLFFVPTLDKENPGHLTDELLTAAKSLNIKARACTSFSEAYELAKNAVDERDGLVTIAGSTSLIREYWRLRGIKKF